MNCMPDCCWRGMNGKILYYSVTPTTKSLCLVVEEVSRLFHHSTWLSFIIFVLEEIPVVRYVDLASTEGGDSI